MDGTRLSFLRGNWEDGKNRQGIPRNFGQAVFFACRGKDKETAEIKTFRMHDIVYEFARFLLKKESLIMNTEAADSPKEMEQKIDSHGNKLRHLILIRGQDAPFPVSIGNPEKLHSCVVQSFHDCPSLVIEQEISTIPPNIFNRFKCIKALDLSRNRLCELPNEVGLMMNLRYLNLSHNPLGQLPNTVCELFNLQTLKLIACEHLNELPRGLGQVINLRHLEIDGTKRLKSFPEGIRNLKALRTLSKFIIGSGVDTTECKLGDLGNLNILQGSLKIEGLGYVEEASEAKKAHLKKKTDLYDLHMDFSAPELGRTTGGSIDVAKALEFPPALKCLEISSYGGTEFPGFSKNLRELRLLDCSCEQLPALGGLPSLETLYMESMPAVKFVGHEFLGVPTGTPRTSFRSLKKLVMKKMSNWETWEFVGSLGVATDNITIMPYLSYLRLSNCNKLKSIPQPFLQHLDKLLIHDCPIVKAELEADKKNISHIADIRMFN